METVQSQRDWIKPRLGFLFSGENYDPGFENPGLMIKPP